MAAAMGLSGLVAGCGSSGTTTGTGGSGGSAGQVGSGGPGTGVAGGPGGSGGAGAAGVGGTSGSGTVTHCDINNFGTQECIEYSAGFPSAEQGCGVLKGAYTTGPCDLTGSSGGCKQMFGSATQIVYYYTATVSADTVMAQCVNDGNATYVAP